MSWKEPKTWMPFPRFLDAGFTIQTGPVKVRALFTDANASKLPQWQGDVWNVLHFSVGAACAYLQALAALCSTS